MGKQMIALYISSHGALTTAPQQSLEFYNKETGEIDKEVSPTKYIGHVEVSIEATPESKEAEA